MNRKWFVGTRKKRFRIPFWSCWACKYVPQPRWLKRWYFRKSYEWWDHPSNHHWKGSCFCVNKPLLPGERDLWSGLYHSGGEEVIFEDENVNGKMPFPD